LRFLRAYASTNGRPPTQREMCRHMRVASMNAVRAHLLGLAKRGLIEWQPDVARGVRVVRRPEGAS